jgi:MFS family permease
VIVDRTDKLRLLKAAQSLLGLQAAALWWFMWPTAHGWVAARRGDGQWTDQRVRDPHAQSLVIELVGREDRPGAMALNSSGFNLARIIGPSIGAVIIAKFGLAWCFGVNAISYITVLAGLFLIRLPAWTPPGQLVGPLDGIREGIRYMRDTRSISALMRIVTVYSVLGTPYLTLMPVMARDRLALGAAGYGACSPVSGLAEWLEPCFSPRSATASCAGRCCGLRHSRSRDFSSCFRSSAALRSPIPFCSWWGSR